MPYIHHSVGAVNTEKLFTFCNRQYGRPFDWLDEFSQRSAPTLEK